MSKRERIDGGRGGRRYVRRDKQGQFDEVEAVGRSSAQDGKRQAKNPSTPGQGDKGDRDAAEPNEGNAARRRAKGTNASITKR